MDTVDQFGNTPIMFAAMAGGVDVSDFLCVYLKPFLFQDKFSPPLEWELPFVLLACTLGFPHQLHMNSGFN